MFFVHPVGIEDREMDRLPWVSIGIAVACALAFAATWVFSSNRFAEQPLEAVLEYWEQHPNLPVPETLRASLRPDVLPHLDRLHQHAVQKRGEAKPEEHAELARRVAAVESARQRSLLYRFALVPARGLVQPGWLTAIFLHAGWFHLLGNLFFLFLTGLLLEDAWGRPFYAGFYLLGGLLAGLAHAASDFSSIAPALGASGAIAACMGAFSFRFANKRIRMGYVLWLWWFVRWGSFGVPAWVAGLAWFALEVADWALGSNSGVAVLAHIGGFAFGFGAAVLLRATGFEDRFLTPAVLAKTGNLVRPRQLDLAEAALARGDFGKARELGEQLLEVYPKSVDVRYLVFRVDRSEGKPTAGARLNALVSTLLAQNRDDALEGGLAQIGDDLDVALLKPAVAYPLARRLEALENPNEALLESLYRSVSSAPGAPGAFALMRRAELAYRRGDSASANEALDLLAKRGDIPPDTAKRAQAVREAPALSFAAPGKRRYISLDETPAVETAAPTGPPPRVLTGPLLELGDNGLVVQAADGKRWRVAFAKILGIAPGRLSTAPDADVPLTDLVLKWGNAAESPVVLRLEENQLGLPARYPELPPADAYGRWLQELLQRSEAEAFPDRFALTRGDYDTHVDIEAMNRKLYRA